MASPDPDHVRQLIAKSRKPIVFRGLIDSWPMLKFGLNDWNNLFKEKLLECRVGEINYKGNEPQWEGQCINIKCMYSTLIAWTKGDDKEEIGDLSDLETSKHFLYFGYKYMKDIFDEEVLRMTEWKPFGFPERNGRESTFWLGTPGANTPCHYDTYGCNLVAQLYGKKRWILFPPEDTDFLLPTRIPYEESSVYSRINFEQWTETIPDIEGTHPHVVELLPGDVLFVPRHWWHYVHNKELSVSVNTWLELAEEDREARLHESLVKFMVAHTSRNLSPSTALKLLNPNEEDMPYSDLQEIEGFIRYSLSAMAETRTDQGQVEVGNAPNGNESWLLPVVCNKSSSAITEPDSKKARSLVQKLETLDIIRAFCHPRVIQTISTLLLEEFNS